MSDGVLGVVKLFLVDTCGVRCLRLRCKRQYCLNLRQLSLRTRAIFVNGWTPAKRIVSPTQILAISRLDSAPMVAWHGVTARDTQICHSTDHEIRMKATISTMDGSGAVPFRACSLKVESSWSAPRYDWCEMRWELERRFQQYPAKDVIAAYSDGVLVHPDPKKRRAGGNENNSPLISCVILPCVVFLVLLLRNKAGGRGCNERRKQTTGRYTLQEEAEGMSHTPTCRR